MTELSASRAKIHAAIALDFAESNRGNQTPHLVVGPLGFGKTLLLDALSKTCAAASPQHRVVRIDGASFGPSVEAETSRAYRLIAEAVFEALDRSAREVDTFDWGTVAPASVLTEIIADEALRDEPVVIFIVVDNLDALASRRVGEGVLGTFRELGQDRSHPNLHRLHVLCAIDSLPAESPNLRSILHWPIHLLQPWSEEESIAMVGGAGSLPESAVRAIHAAVDGHPALVQRLAAKAPRDRSFSAWMKSDAHEIVDGLLQPNAMFFVSNIEHRRVIRALLANPAEVAKTATITELKRRGIVRVEKNVPRPMGPLVEQWLTRITS